MKQKIGTKIAPSIAPNQNTLGVMLPYTPLHYLLFNKRLMALVMTSGNIAEEPIAYTNDEARDRLSTMADAFLMHNREIHTRCDDSVVRVMGKEKSGKERNNKQPKSISNIYPIRRSRGYAPNPLLLPFEDTPQLLATGSELKNTYCLTKGKYAFLSHHIGDMENYETLQSFESGIKHFERLFRCEPEAIVCDLHPNYLATRYAQERAQSSNLPIYKIQHHHAHIASCMADNNLIGDRPLIGVSFDGTGYGEDNAIWGGEFMLADYETYQRFTHLEYSPLPGGDAATRNPARIALAQLRHAGIDWDEDLPPVKFLCGDELTLLSTMIKNDINCPRTSSMGRLFDAVAALSGLRGKVNYEGQAAIEFEALADPEDDGFYPFEFDGGSIKVKALLQAVIKDIRSSVSVSSISARFHNGLANMILEICQIMSHEYLVNEVALSGGVWQNMTLLKKTIFLLERNNFKVYIHKQVPTNDGGLSLGQAVIAINSINR
jgi:hydrogenase maturation protein HypF